MLESRHVLHFDHDMLARLLLLVIPDVDHELHLITEVEIELRLGVLVLLLLPLLPLVKAFEDIEV